MTERRNKGIIMYITVQKLGICKILESFGNKFFMLTKATFI